MPHPLRFEYKGTLSKYIQEISQRLCKALYHHGSTELYFRFLILFIVLRQFSPRCKEPMFILRISLQPLIPSLDI